MGSDKHAVLDLEKKMKESGKYFLSSITVDLYTEFEFESDAVNLCLELYSCERGRGPEHSAQGPSLMGAHQ